MQKRIFLFLALILPVAIFLFLKKFGRNEFVVEPLFQDSVNVSSSACAAIQYEVPYVVPDSLIEALEPAGKAQFLVVIFSERNDESLNQVQRIEKEFETNSLGIVKITEDSAELAPTTKWFQRDEVEKMKTCVLLLQPPANAAVLDRAGRRIMGQYDITDLDEADRLILELKILFKKY